MHIHHPPTHPRLSQSSIPTLLPCPPLSRVAASTSLLPLRRQKEEGPLRPREIAQRAGKGKSTPNAISHVVGKRYSRVRLSRKSPPGIFAAGHLRARRSPLLRSGENWERRRCMCARAYVDAVCRNRPSYVRVCVCVCVCGTSRIRGIFRHRSVGGGSERDPGDRLIARPIVGADRRAKASRAKMRAIFDIRGTFIAALLSRARERAQTCY